MKNIVKKLYRNNFVQIYGLNKITIKFVHELEKFVFNKFVENKENYYIFVLDLYFENDIENSDSNIFQIIITVHNNICFSNIITNNDITEIFKNDLFKNQNFQNVSNNNSYFLYQPNFTNKFQFFEQ